MVESATGAGTSLARVDRMAHNIAAYGLYPSLSALESAISSFESNGFRTTDISVLYPESMGTRDLAHEASTKAPEGIATGAATGVAVGGVLGWLAAVGAIAIPGIGPLIAAGPIVAALAGAGAAGTAGGLVGGLVGLGMPEYEAKRYEGRIKNGGILLSVHCDDNEWARRAKKILQDTGAEHVSTSSEASADYQP